MAKRAANFRAALDKVDAELTRKHKGRKVIGRADEMLETPSLWVSTGSLSLDRLIRGWNPGGIPVGPQYGRIVHIAGDPSTGKSVILDHIMTNVQKIGGLAMVAETEASREKHFAQAIGMNWKELTVSKAESGTIEEVFDILYDWHKKIRKQVGDKVPIIQGVDSIDSMESTKTYDKDMSSGGSQHYGGGRPQAIGLALKRFNSQICSHYPTTLVLLNQVRINPMAYGDSRYTPGGKAIHFYSSVELMLGIAPKPLGELRSHRKVNLTDEQRKRLGLGKTDRGNVFARWIRVAINKTKVSSTFKERCDFLINFDKGISAGAGLFSRLIVEGVVTLEGKRVIHGPEADGNIFESETDWVRWLMKNPKALTLRSPHKPIHNQEESDGDDVEGTEVETEVAED